VAARADAHAPHPHTPQWVLESFTGCVDSCSDNTPAGDAYLARAPFKGALQLPRRVAYSAETRSLALLPIAELGALRRDKARSMGRGSGAGASGGGGPRLSGGGAAPGARM
jgi:hypothetical protein